MSSEPQKSKTRTKLSGPIRSLQLKDDSGVHEKYSVANIFADTFAREVIVKPPLKDLSLSNKYNPNCIEDPSFSSEIVLGRLKKIKTYNSPGPDLISANVLKNCADSLAVSLSILNLSSREKFP